MHADQGGHHVAVSLTRRFAGTDAAEEMTVETFENLVRCRRFRRGQPARPVTRIVMLMRPVVSPQSGGAVPANTLVTP